MYWLPQLPACILVPACHVSPSLSSGGAHGGGRVRHGRNRRWIGRVHGGGTHQCSTQGLHSEHVRHHLGWPNAHERRCEPPSCIHSAQSAHVRIQASSILPRHCHTARSICETT